MRISPIVPITGYLALAACATTALDDDRIVFLDIDGDNTCIVTLDERAFALPDAATALARQLQRDARRGASAVIGPRPSRARPGCWDEAVAAVNAARFRRIGFLTDEPDGGRRGG